MRITSPDVTMMATQSDASKLKVEVAHVDHAPHYKVLPHDEMITAWTPASGSHIHATGVVISVQTAGVVTLYHGNMVFATLHFNEKKAMPMPIIEDLTFGEDAVFKAKYHSDTTALDTYITVLGYEHA